MIFFFTKFFFCFLFSLNDSFARIKRELAAKKYRNEMTDFMWSAFRKVVGINNQEILKNDDEKIKMENINKKNIAPLATLNVDEL